MFCRGPPGPKPVLYAGLTKNVDLPLTASLVQEDVLVRFLATLKSKTVDRTVTRGIKSNRRDAAQTTLVRQPTIFSKSTETSIAVSNNPWISGWNGRHNTLSGRYCLDNGLTRRVCYRLLFPTQLNSG